MALDIQVFGRAERAIVSCVLVAACSAGAQTSLIVRTEPRVELLSIIFHLAGATVYNQNRLPSYARDVDSTFAGFRDHAAVRRARRYEDSLGIGFDKPMEFAERLADARTLRAIIPIDTPAPEWQWPPGSGQVFLTDLRAFVHDAPAARFFRAHSALYDTATRRMRRLVDFWRALPARLPTLVARYDSLRPRVVTSRPADGDTAVDPTATTLAIRFDRPMRAAWALNPLRQDTTARFPVTAGQIAYDPGHTTLTVPIRLVPGQTYAIVLGRAFQSQDGGIPLARTVIRFHSAGSAGRR